MAVTTLDSHEAVKELFAAGLTEDRAEAVSRVVRRSQDIDGSNLATKADLAKAKAELQTALAETKSPILKWMTGPFGVQTVVIVGTGVALMKTLVH